MITSETELSTLSLVLERIHLKGMQSGTNYESHTIDQLEDSNTMKWSKDCAIKEDLGSLKGSKIKGIDNTLKTCNKRRLLAYTP